jgi:hypothetical protein
MVPLVSALWRFLGSLFRSRQSLHLQVLVLQHQVAIYQQTIDRPQLHLTDHRVALLGLACPSLRRLAA